VPNWDKLVRRHQSDVLEDGEEIVATLFFLPRGGVVRAGVAGGVGGVLGGAGAAAGMRAGCDAAMRQAAEGQDGETVAGSFPVCFGLITLTDRRVLVFDRGAVSVKKPQRLVGAYPRSALVGATSRKAGLKRDLTLRFSDGSSIDLDGGIQGPYDAFERAVSV
jgi:hypothetical protein